MSATDNPLVNDLGGSAGFGENVLNRNDDGSTGFIDFTSVFESGLNFFGTNYNGFYINNNGNITFNNSSSIYTPFAITGNTAIPIIAPFFTDIDTRAGTVTPSSGGNSTGSNLVYWDLEPANEAVTITWDDVGEYSYGTTPNAFQMRLRDTGGGNFTIEFRYEDIQWYAGNARAGYSAADGTNFFELLQSGTSEMLDLETASNTSESGVFIFSVVNGIPNQPPTDIDLSQSSVDENSPNGTVIGTLTTTDPDADDLHTYTLLDDAGGRFAINGNRLVVANSALLDFETASSYNIIVRTRDAGSSTYDGSFSISLNNVPEPDLQFTAATAPDTANLGQTIQVNWAVTNQGDGTALADWVDYVYISDDQTLDGRDIFVNSISAATFSPLVPNGSYSQTQNITIPNTVLGNRYLLFVADRLNNQIETNESNNVRVVPIELTAPDLVVNNITAPVEALSGQQIELVWTVTNQGTADATSTWTDYIYLSNDSAIGDDLYIANFPFAGTIAAGESIERRQLITVPIDLSGNYQIVVSTDGNNQLLEGNEANNTVIDDRAIQVRLSPFPNLQVSNVTAPPTAFSSQETVIQWTVTNTGNGATSAPLWNDNVWLSLDNTFDSTDTFLGSVANASYLNVDESYTNSLTVKLPQGIDGNYYFLVNTDANSNVFELGNEGDNFGFGGPTDVDLTPPPDLQVTSVNAPAQGFSGQSLTLSWTATNQAPGRNLETSWYDEIFMSADQVLDASDLLLGRRSQSSTFNSGDSYNATQTVTLPIGVSGEFFFFVRTDAGSQVYENVFEGNNTGYDTTATRINLTPPPDLEVEFVNAPAEASASRSLTLNYRVTNFGATATPNSSWTDTFYLSTDFQLDPNTDLRLGTQTHFGVLDIGASYDNSATFTLPDGITGTYYAFAVTDSANDVFELNNDNNIVFDAALVSISSRPADLVISANAPTIVEAGKAIRVNWTVTNQGIGDTAVANWTDRVVASTDAVLGNGDDVQLVEFEHSGLLNPGSSYSRSELVTIPFNLAGQYNLFVATDANGRVYEAANEGNNSVVQPITISRQTPDLRVTQLSTPTTAVSGQLFTVNWTVQNFGAGRTNTDYWYDDVYLSADSLISGDDVSLGRVYHSGTLEASTLYSVSRTFDLPVNIGGEFYTIVRTDSTSRVLETPLEDNNDLATSGTTTIALGPVPDLVVADVDAPTTSISGQLLNVTWTVHNDGAAGTGDRSWFDAFYLSRDQIFDRSSDTYLGIKARTGTLVAGANYTDTASFTIPQGLSGPLYVFAVTDSGNSINERDREQNNVGYDGNSTQVNLLQLTDLVVGTITIPANGVPGQNATISYTVTNQGTNAALGNWSDSIYISADNQWDVGDAFFGRVQHFGDVSSGDSYSETLTAPLPGVLPGDYYVIIRSDIRNQIPESNEENNLKASLNQFNADAERLELGTPVTGTLGQDQAVYYRVDVVAGETLAIAFDSESPDGFNELYVSREEIPRRADFDFASIEPFSADQRVVIPTTEAGTYFIQAFGNDVSGGAAAYDITAELVEFSVFDNEYGRGGNVGNLTIEINGAKFDRTVTARLTDGAGVNLPAVSLFYEDQTQVFATFDLRGLTPGVYDVVVENAEGDSITVDDGLEVVQGGGSNILPQVDAPRSVARNRGYTFTVSWGNSGLNDGVTPVLLVENTVPFGFSPGDTSAGSSYNFLGVNTNGGPPGVLRPGQSESRTFFSFSDNQPGDYTVTVDRLYKDLDAPFDWEVLRQSLTPVGITKVEFDPFFNQLIAQVGTTTSDYLEMLARNSVLLPEELGRSDDVGGLLELEVRKAQAAVSTSLSGMIEADELDVDISGRTVIATNTDTSETFSTITLNDGSFIFASLTPGEYSFEVTSAIVDDQMPMTVEVLPEQALSGVSLAIDNGGIIEGQVTAAFMSLSVEDAFITLFDDGEQVVSTARPNSEGNYLLSGLDAGNYTLQVVAEGLSRTWVSDLIVGDDGTVTVDVSLPEESTIFGNVVDATGQPLDNIIVAAQLQNKLPDNTVSSQITDGAFEVGSLGAGTYTIAIMNPDTTVLLENVEVAGGSTLDLGTIQLDVLSPQDVSISAASSDLDIPLEALSEPNASFQETVALENVAAQNWDWRLSWEQSLDLIEAVTPPRLILEARILGGSEAAALYRKYFESPGPNPPERFGDGHPISESFENSSVTQGNVSRVQSDAFNTIKQQYENTTLPCEHPEINREIPIDSLSFPSDFLLSVIGPGDTGRDDWNFPYFYPGAAGILAGAVGQGGGPGSAHPGVFTDDARFITGVANVNIPAGSSQATVTFDLTVRVEDTVDFSPGNIAFRGSIFHDAQILEENGRAFDVPFVSEFKVDSQTFNFSVDLDDDCDDDDHDDEDDTSRPTSSDPNDILGPDGFGEEGWITADDPLEYTIRFENDPVFATAPAQVVRITQQLDSDLDFRTFRVSDFGFGDVFVDVPDNRAFYQTTLDLSEDLGILVEVIAGIDVSTGEAFWEFTAIDPATGQLPLDALTGFLPPNFSSPEGEGFVNYSIRPQTTVTTGDVIDAEATIVFDINEPINTPPIFNTLDTEAPTSSVAELPVLIEDVNREFLVRWSGSDDTNGSALANFTIYVSDNGSLFVPWLENTTLTEASYLGQSGHTYAFYSVARDNAGNIEAAPSTPDTQTTVPGTVTLSTLAFSAAEYSINEDGTLTTAISINRTNNTHGTLSATVTLTNGTAFSPADYDNTPIVVNFADGETSKIVTIPIVNDAVVEGNESLSLSLETSGSYELGEIDTTTVTIIDNDTAGVTISESDESTNVTEGGPTDTYTVALTRQPTADVTIAINGDTQITTSVNTLTFTAANWNQAQTVNITAVDDDVLEGNHSSTLTFTTASADVNYNAIALPSVNVNITDNEALNGTPGRDTLTGSDGNDIIIGLQGADILTGSAASDQFVYTTIRDAGDQITDFVPGTDKIVFTQLFQSYSLGSLNYGTATTQGYLSFGIKDSNTTVLIDPDSSAGRALPTPLLTVQNVSQSSLANADNFVF